MKMQISTRKYERSYNLFSSHRVVSENPLPAGFTAQTPLCLYYTLQPLLDMKPNWRFVGNSNASLKLDSEKVMIFTDFNIFEDDECLGNIDIGWKGKDQKIRVDNARIRAARERGRFYHTDDPTKATLAIRRNFFTKDTEERFADAVIEASNTLARELNNKIDVRRRLFKDTYSQATEFVTNNMDAYLARYPGLAEHYARYMDAKAEAAVVSKIKDLFDNDRALLVVLTETHYIVRQRESGKSEQEPGHVFVRYTDEDLPEFLRMRIGILKLVQDGQMVSTAGTRVNKTTFVILPESVENAA